jgi:hypothetical protein
MKFKSTKIAYTINCKQNLTTFSTKLDLCIHVPYVEILETNSPTNEICMSQEKFNLCFHDKKSVEQLMLCLQTIKDEMDRFEPGDQSVS